MAPRANGGSTLADNQPAAVVFEPRQTASSRTEIIRLVQLVGLHGKELATFKVELHELFSRIALIEEKLRGPVPLVEYVAEEAIFSDSTVQTCVERLPRLYRNFFVVSLSLTLLFAALLLLGGVGFAIIHPFVASVGFLGSLGWLVTSVVDLQSWRSTSDRTPA